MNIIALDPSLTCTALVVNDKKFIFAKEEYGVSEKSGNLTKWFEICDPYITYSWVNYIKSAVHTEQEILKLIGYDSLTDHIVETIKANINDGEDTYIGIEGYSYSSTAGPLIDLVTFSTLLRKKLFDKISSNIKVYAPAELKLEAAKITYDPIVKGVKVKKYEYRNGDGVAGGSFKKPEMYRVLTEHKSIQCPYVDLLREYQDIILKMRTVPKPIEDMNDAKILYEVIKKDKYSQ